MPLLGSPSTSISVFVRVLITETLLSKEFVTYALLPSGVKATRWGPSPTGIVTVTVLVLVSITETSSEKLLTTYATVACS